MRSLTAPPPPPTSPPSQQVARLTKQSLRAGKGAPRLERSVERIASCVVYLEQDGALVAWEAEGAPRVLVDGDMFFAAHAACGTLEGLEEATDGDVTRKTLKLMLRGLAYSGALLCSMRECERRMKLGETQQLCCEPK